MASELENYNTRSTLGQPSPLMDPANPPNSTSYELYPGFWYTYTLETDTDGDGIPNYEDNCPATPNGSANGTCIHDSDKPGVQCTSDDDCSSCGPGIPGLCSMNQEDADSDGVGDVCDNCPDNCNFEQLDADLDGIGDVCDPDPGCGCAPACEPEC